MSKSSTVKNVFKSGEVSIDVASATLSRGAASKLIKAQMDESTTAERNKVLTSFMHWQRTEHSERVAGETDDIAKAVAAMSAAGFEFDATVSGNGNGSIRFRAPAGYTLAGNGSKALSRLLATSK